jgi:hypothetical protein
MVVNELIVAKADDLKKLGYDFDDVLKTDEEITELLLEVIMTQKANPTVAVYLTPKALEIVSKIWDSNIYKNYNICKALVDKNGNCKSISSVVNEILNKKSVEPTPDDDGPKKKQPGLKLIRHAQPKEQVKMIVKGQTCMNKVVQQNNLKDEKVYTSSYLKKIKSFFKNNKFTSLFAEGKDFVSTKQLADTIGIDPQKMCTALGRRGIYITSYASKTVKRHCYFSLGDFRSLKKDIVRINVDKIYQLRNYKLTRENLKYKNETACNFFDYFVNIPEEEIKGCSVVCSIRNFYKKNNINSLSTKPVINELKYVIGYQNYYNNSSNSVIIKKFLMANYDAKKSKKMAKVA